MLAYEFVHNVLDAIDGRMGGLLSLTRGPALNGRVFVFAAREAAERLLRLPAGHLEADRRIGADCEFLRLAGDAIAERP